MPIGMWGYTPVGLTVVLVCLFFVCPQDFGKGYLRPRLTEVDEIW